MKGYYVLKLTNRHNFPEEAKWAIFSSRNVGHTVLDDMKRVEVYMQQGDKAIPRDCKQLKVYMSGFELYRYCLLRIAKRRGIALTLMWSDDDGETYREDSIKIGDLTEKLSELKSLMKKKGFDTSKLK